MSRCYLFGPVTAAFADQNLRSARQAGDCLAFGAGPGLDLQTQPGDCWETLTARLPAGWQPDFVALYLPYTVVPKFLWSVPLVALAADWNLLWHAYRDQLGHCDLVLTDTVGVETCRRQGIAHVHPANLFGLERAFLEYQWPSEPRPLDILFVGNTNPAVQAERLQWLSRLARLGERWEVTIRTGVFGDDYRKLLGQARIVFNRSIRGECNKRVFEAVAAGALLFQEAGNREVPGYFRDRQECVYYTEDNLEELLTYYLEHEDERRAIAEAARVKVARYSFESLWRESVNGLIEQEWPGMVERARQRQSQAPSASLRSRTWQAFSSSDTDPTLAADLAAALVEDPKSAELHNALGLLHSRAGQPQAVQTALSYFQRALSHQPNDAMVALNAAECLVVLHQDQPAVDLAHNALAILDSGALLNRETLGTPHFPVAFNDFRVEWERAAWANAGQPAAEERAKRHLLRWRLHLLLAELTGEVHHYYEAAMARPDLPITQAMLGCALARGGKVQQAIPHLREALGANPFDRTAARALFLALGETKDVGGERRLARKRRVLAKVAPQVVPAEAWFTDAPPVGDELASILILCCNELEYTRRCLESVLRHTRSPYELVIVDNGSTDGTPAYLEEFKQRSGPSRVAVIRNDQNRGYAAGCNQALAQAHGDYIVFLNNDTVVTPGWLDGLIAWSLSDWPNVGLVGAVTNYSRPPQQIDVDYTDLTGMLPFAARRRQEFSGKALVVERLTGFCLLARRAVLEKIGTLDEGYGIGFFEDDDVSVRAREAGFKLLVALDVFIHHFGSRTFAGLGVNCQEQLRQNFERFREKWGEKHSAGYRVPEPPPETKTAPPPPTPPKPVLAWPEEQVADTVARALAAKPTAIAAASPAHAKPKVSLCMIVKNEEANLPDCLGSVTDLVDEVVVVDTGSTDKTKEIAQRFGAKVHDFPWIDNFAAARNESLKHAAGDWIFWMDADDRLDEDNRQKLRTFLSRLPDENAAYVMKCVCLPDPISKTTTVVDHLRLFRNDPEIRWKYRVHEQILPAIRKQQGEVRWSDVEIHHVGYQDPALRRRKLERDIRLLQLEDQEHPNDPFNLFNLGQVLQEVGKAAEAIPVLRRSLELSSPGDSIVRKLYALIAGCHRQLGQHAEALAACGEGRRYYPDDAEILFQESLARCEQRDYAGAEACLLKLLTTREGDHFASVAVGLRGHKARSLLANLYQEQGRAAEAEAQWKAAAAEAPGFAPAWQGLAELYLGQSRWTELNEAAEKLAAAGGELETAVLRARGHLAQKDFTGARQLLEQAVERFPRAIKPGRLLTYVLLQEGKDPAGAERALLALLELDPNDAEAKKNLALLRQRRGVAVIAPVATSRTPVPAGEPEDLRGQAFSLVHQAGAQLREGDIGAATGTLEEAVRLARQIDDRSAEITVLANVGLAALAAGHTQLALDIFGRQREAARAAGDHGAELSALSHQAKLIAGLNDRAVALGLVEQALPLARNLEDRSVESELLWLAAVLHDGLGQRDQALRHAEATLAVMEQTKHQHAAWFIDQVQRYQANGSGTGLGLLPDGETEVNEDSANGSAEPEHALQPAGPLGMAWSATKALAKFAGSGFETARPEVQQQRLQACQSCEHHTGRRCRFCGCFTEMKAKFPTERCPLGRWPA